MMKICILVLMWVSSTLCQSESELKAQFEDEKSITKAFDNFLMVLEYASSQEVNYYKDTVHNLLPSIRSLQRVHFFANTHFKDDSPKLEPAKEAFRLMNKQISQIDIALDRFLVEDPPSANATVMQWYKDHRAPISAVEENVLLFGASTTTKERQHFSRALDEECQRNDPGQFFIERPQVRSIDRAQALAILSEGEDRAKLIKWVKMIAGDAVRAMSMHEACSGIWGKPSANDVDTAWAKISQIFDDLKKQADRLSTRIEEQPGTLGFDAQAQLAQFTPETGSLEVANTLGQGLSAKHPNKFLGVFVLGGAFEKQGFDSQHALEIPFGTRTVLIFWEEKGKHKNETQQEQIKTYLENVPCAPEFDYGNYRFETLKKVSDDLRRLGARAVYVTDANYGSRIYPQVSIGNRKRCDAAKGSPKTTWQYTGSIIVGY